MSTHGAVNHRDKCYRKPRKSVCRYPKCASFIKMPGQRKWVAINARSPIMGAYCSQECFERHREEIRAGAAERVREFLEKKAKENINGK